METFEHDGKKHISINGKDYFLIRGYANSRDNFIFAQVHGRTPLRQEDMPSKGWDVLSSGAMGQRVWTAFVKSYFAHDTARENPTLAFIGASTQGSFYLALRFIAKRFGLDCDETHIHRLAGVFDSTETYSRRLTKLRDQGNSGVSMISVSFDSYFDEDDAKELLKGET